MKIIVLIIFILTTQSSFANVGQNGGGGSRLESAFRLTAFELIHQISKNSVANSLCSAQTMRAGLDQSKINVVDILIDLDTGHPTLDQHLDAWTRPGNIQLRLSAWIK